MGPGRDNEALFKNVEMTSRVQEEGISWAPVEIQQDRPADVLGSEKNRLTKSAEHDSLAAVQRRRANRRRLCSKIDAESTDQSFSPVP